MLQTAQTGLKGLRRSRSQQERDSVASLDRPIDLRSASISFLHQPMGSQLHPYLYSLESSPLESLSPVWFITILWDSRWLLPNAWSTKTGIFTWIITKLMGQHMARRGAQAGRTSWNSENQKSRQKNGRWESTTYNTTISKSSLYGMTVIYFWVISETL